MTTKGRKLSAYLAIFGMPLGLATVGLADRASRSREVSSVNAAQETNAAYRDGVFLGELDGREGRKVAPSIARWNSDADRALFRAGYEKGYSDAVASTLAAPRL